MYTASSTSYPSNVHIYILYIMHTHTFIFIDISGYYDESNYSMDNANLYFTVVLNISVFYAFIVLAHFYHAFSYLLRKHEPMFKFLCIKFVIFFAFWQGICISLLIYFNILRGSNSYSTEMLSATLQDMLICFEMFIVSIAHICKFIVVVYV